MAITLSGFTKTRNQHEEVTTFLINTTVEEIRNKEAQSAKSPSQATLFIDADVARYYAQPASSPK